MIVTDQQIIGNTHFREEDGKLICYTMLPGDEKFEEVVPDRKTVQKNMIGWCNTIHEYLRRKEVADEEERLARKARRKSGISEDAVVEKVGPQDPKAAVIEWYHTTQDKIDELGRIIEEATEQRNKLRDERDRVEPIIKAWKGSE
jgi:hypothetical protein